MSKKVSVIILCAGVSKRFKNNVPKQLYKINQKSLLQINLEIFTKNNSINDIVVVSSKKYLKKTNEISNKFSSKIVIGGKTRQQSVYNGLKALKKRSPNFVLIHDCARPFVTQNLIDELIKNTTTKNASIPAIKIVDSVKKITEEKSKVIDRENLFSIQTPQCFPFEIIYNAHKNTKSISFTDDSSLVEKLNFPVKIVEGSRKNIKITSNRDIPFAKMIYNSLQTGNFVNKVGLGFDVHKFEKGDKVTLCGIDIPFDKKLIGHSDADVCFHSIVDAILGSLSLGDIGDHFPPNEKKWKNANSKIFMDFAKIKLAENNAEIQNLDLTIICEQPKIGKYKQQMREQVSSILDLSVDLVNVKATTSEKLGFTGREEGIAAQSIVLIKSESKTK